MNRVALFQKFGWKKIAILQSVEEVFTSTAKDLERRCKVAYRHHLDFAITILLKSPLKEADISVTWRQSFLGDPSDAMANLGRQDPRIIVGLFYETEARRVFCQVILPLPLMMPLLLMMPHLDWQVYKEGLYGRRYVWFLIGWYSDRWYEPVPGEGLNCSADQMREAAALHITTEALMLSDAPTPGPAARTGHDFVDALRERLPKASNETAGWVSLRRCKVRGEGRRKCVRWKRRWPTTRCGRWPLPSTARSGAWRSAG